MHTASPDPNSGAAANPQPHGVPNSSESGSLDGSQVAHDGNGQYVDAKTIAEMLAVTPEYVRERWRELGGFRLPSKGGQGRLRFDPVEVKHRLLPAPPISETPEAKKPRIRQPGSSVPLLPIHARNEKENRNTYDHNGKAA